MHQHVRSLDIDVIGDNETSRQLACNTFIRMQRFQELGRLGARGSTHVQNLGIYSVEEETLTEETIYIYVYPTLWWDCTPKTRGGIILTASCLVMSPQSDKITNHFWKSLKISNFLILRRSTLHWKPFPSGYHDIWLIGNTLSPSMTKSLKWKSVAIRSLILRTRQRLSYGGILPSKHGTYFSAYAHELLIRKVVGNGTASCFINVSHSSGFTMPCS